MADLYLKYLEIDEVFNLDGINTYYKDLTFEGDDPTDYVVEIGGVYPWSAPVGWFEWYRTVNPETPTIYYPNQVLVRYISWWNINQVLTSTFWAIFSPVTVPA
jgi:hypothetical protein